MNENADAMFKLCSDLSEIFTYPYYFNWSPATNYRYGQRMTYAMIRIGRYCNRDTEDMFCRSKPIEKQLCFAPVSHLFDFDFMNWLFDIMDFDSYIINSLDDVKAHKDEIIKKLEGLYDESDLKVREESTDTELKDTPHVH